MSKPVDLDFFRGVALTLDSLGDKLLRGIEELQAEREHLERFYTAALSAHGKLLSLTSQKLLEKHMNDLLEEEDKKQKRAKNINCGVPMRVLKK